MAGKRSPYKIWLEQLTVGQIVILSEDKYRRYAACLVTFASPTDVSLMHDQRCYDFSRQSGRVIRGSKNHNLYIQPHTDDFFATQALGRLQDLVRDLMSAFPVGLLTEEETTHWLTMLATEKQRLLDRLHATKEHYYD